MKAEINHMIALLRSQKYVTKYHFHTSNETFTANSNIDTVTVNYVKPHVKLEYENIKVPSQLSMDKSTIKITALEEELI